METPALQIGRVAMEAAKLEFHLETFLFEASRKWGSACEIWRQAASGRSLPPANLPDQISLACHLIGIPENGLRLADRDGEVSAEDFEALLRGAFEARNWVVHGACDLVKNSEDGSWTARFRKFSKGNKNKRRSTYEVDDVRFEELTTQLRYLKIASWELLDQIRKQDDITRGSEK